MNVLSSVPTVPAPNCTCRKPWELNLVTNLFGTFWSSIELGTLSASVPTLVSPTNTLSWPKKGTSCHLVVSSSLLSVILSIPIMFVSSIVIVVNFSAVVNVCVVVFTFPENAFTFLVSRNSDGIPLDIWDITISVGSYELEKLKSTLFSMKMHVSYFSKKIK